MNQHNNTTSGAEDLTDTVAKALRRAWQLGQIYWQQADIEGFSQQKKLEATHAAFVALLDATRAALASPTPQADRQPAPVRDYPPLPEPKGKIQFPACPYESAWVSGMDAYDESQMQAFVDADRAARAQADSVPEDAALTFTGAHIDYVARYGGRCRDCADESGVCPGSGLPCAGSRKAIKHVFDALEYGVKHGYIKSPIAARKQGATP